jgi:hypothetical protein
LITLAQAILIIYSAALLCRLFAFTVYLFGGRLSSAGYLVARAFMIIFLFGTLFSQTAMNPLQLLYLLNKSPQIIGWSFVVHMVIVFSAILFFTVINHKLVKRHMKLEMTT